MKKKALFVALLLCAASFYFAERRTRVDTYRNYTVKCVWDDNYWNAPPDKNLAQEWYDDNAPEWESVRQYRYFPNTKLVTWIAADVELYESKEGWYEVIIEYLRYGLWEKNYDRDFYTYNDAYNVFKKIANRFEGLIN